MREACGLRLPIPNREYSVHCSQGELKCSSNTGSLTLTSCGGLETNCCLFFIALARFQTWARNRLAPPDIFCSAIPLIGGLPFVSCLRRKNGVHAIVVFFLSAVCLSYAIRTNSL